MSLSEQQQQQPIHEAEELLERAVEDVKRQKMVPHGKSGKERLAILDLSEDDLIFCIKEVMKKSSIVPNVRIPGSPCITFSADDGRISKGSKKITFAYHVVALLKFGKEALSCVSAQKSEEKAITVSHICGFPNCLNPDHIKLEYKQINDHRVLCHGAFLVFYANEVAKNEIVDISGLRCIKPSRLKEWLGTVCCHSPACCTLYNWDTVASDLPAGTTVTPIVEVKERGLPFKPRDSLNPSLATVPGLDNFRALGTDQFATRPLPADESCIITIDRAPLVNLMCKLLVPTGVRAEKKGINVAAVLVRKISNVISSPVRLARNLASLSRANSGAE